GLNEGKSREPVTDHRGALEVEVLGCLAHVRLQVFLHFPGLAGEELARVFHQFAIGFETDLAGAGTSAALDLVLQAGPCAACVKAVRAIAKQKGLLQTGNRAAHSGRRSEGAEIMAWAPTASTMLGKLGR